ncbi:MAG: RNA methyltransferase [Bacteroidetes bacterium]|nr:RNA methyltransferase [Bacteroidota bacterium]
MHLHLVREPSSDDVARYSDLRSSQQQDHFIAEGEKVVSRLLESTFHIDSIYLTPEHFDLKRSLIESHRQSEEIRVLLGSKAEMERIVGFPLHQGIMASARIPTSPDLSGLIALAPHPHLYVLLDQIADAENMGAIYRTALAMGATAIIVDRKSVSPWNRRSVRVSMGAIFHLPTVMVPELAASVHTLRDHGVRTYATTLSTSASDLRETPLGGDIGLVFGSEGYGVQPSVIAECEGEVTLPMPQSIDSLNVAVAQGVFLYEALRQRGLRAK